MTYYRGHVYCNFAMHTDEIQTGSMGLRVAVIVQIVRIVLIVCAALVHMEPLIQLQCTKEPPCKSMEGGIDIYPTWI